MPLIRHLHAHRTPTLTHAHTTLSRQLHKQYSSLCHRHQNPGHVSVRAPPAAPGPLPPFGAGGQEVGTHVARGAPVGGGTLIPNSAEVNGRPGREGSQQGPETYRAQSSTGEGSRPSLNLYNERGLDSHKTAYENKRPIEHKQSCRLSPFPSRPWHRS